MSNNGFKSPAISILLILFVFLVFAVVIGAQQGNKESPNFQSDSRSGESASTFTPDNCTKCHVAWADRFEYHRCWDRYGYVYEPFHVKSFFDPWYSGDDRNMFLAYYASEWWKTPEIYPWSDAIAQQVESLSILSRKDGLPFIPRGKDEIRGTVITVGAEKADFTSIQKAVDAAKDGTTVFVRAGEYNEVITLKEGVNLIGEDPYTTIINPQNRGHAVRAANHSIIAGFTLTGTGIRYETGEFNCAVYVSGCDSTCVIANNIFRENGLFGVWLEGGSEKEKSVKLIEAHGPRKIELCDHPYTDYPNPVIVGNTFYRIGQRGVFFVHARGEIFNNIFAGNVKALGMERHSRPFVHHNIFYYNNIPMAVNRSEPLVCNNIMLKNQWGQRMLRGANPVIFNNVIFQSPFFRDFDEEGLPIPYSCHPGTGQREIDPQFADPLNGDFTFKESSPLRQETTGFEAVGIMRDANLPQPQPVKCKNSYGREVLSMTDEIKDLILKVEHEASKVRSLSASYHIVYKSYIGAETDRFGIPVQSSFSPSEKPAFVIDYTVPRFTLDGKLRSKDYLERKTAGGETTEDSGTIAYNGTSFDIEKGRFKTVYSNWPDTLFIGERPFREAPGGFYRDYDQYVHGAVGPLGTFYEGCLRIMGGRIAKETVAVDGSDCIVVRYPHIGKDQYFLFYLDPSIGYKLRKMEQFYNEVLYCVMDSYQYKTFTGGIHLPTRVTVTTFIVEGQDRGKVSTRWELEVDEKSLKVNE